MTQKPDPGLAAKGFVYLAAILFGLGYWIYSSYFKLPEAPIKKTAAQDPSGPCITIMGFMAASTESLLDRANSMMANRDTQAAAALMAQFPQSLIVLKGDDEVFVEERKILSGKIRIRPKGKTGTLWTVAEAVDCR